MQNGAAALENIVRSSMPWGWGYWYPSNSTPVPPKRNVDTGLHQNVYMNVHISFIHNSKKSIANPTIHQVMNELWECGMRNKIQIELWQGRNVAFLETLPSVVPG
jgi:hypothetical protein